MRKKTLENCNFVVNQKLGGKHLSVSELKNKINDGDNSIGTKVLYFILLTIGPKEEKNSGL